MRFALSLLGCEIFAIEVGTASDEYEDDVCVCDLFVPEEWTT